MKKKWLLCGLVMLVCGVLVIGCGKKEPSPVTTLPPAEEPAPTPPPPPPPPDPSITVEKVDAIAVMINNHNAADPHSGLQQATFVYEFLVEGGITRFLAVYDRPLSTNFMIGPVRSLRPYFAVTAKEHGKVVAFAGMSGITAEKIAPLRLKLVLDTVGTFWRDKSRVSPHNLYTDLEHMYAARGTSEVRSEKVVPAHLPLGEAGTDVEVIYNSSQIVKYTYDGERNMYLRFQDRVPHTDRETGKQYGATRVIVRKNRHSVIEGTSLLEIYLNGSGKAVLYEAGQKYNITWKKTGGKTVYRFADGNEVDLRLGNTWIQVVR